MTWQPLQKTLLKVKLLVGKLYQSNPQDQLQGATLVGGFSPTPLKNMQPSKWVHLPQGSGMKIPKRFELPPACYMNKLDIYGFFHGVVNIPTATYGKIPTINSKELSGNVRRIIQDVPNKWMALRKYWVPFFPPISS